jgi:16S rRNA (cytidine1402-2'-O)-methyltransferase
MAEILPLDRQIVIAREMTKLHETIIKASVADALALVTENSNMRKGEFVVLVQGAKPADQDLTPEEEHILKVLLKQCSIKTAVSLAVEITGARKKRLYQAALTIQEIAE